MSVLKRIVAGVGLAAAAFLMAGCAEATGGAGGGGLVGGGSGGGICVGPICV
ncbi:hypothetical protein MINTM005_12780 [Mycobacterium intracellulare]|uniref:hypothetical protein n=1 Tax=Mycobacterium intracellulare TaxID=1767 RepID=UPI0019269FFB|nr:hypothetical protein [Mycobacterium intracellulare]BCO56034.1 hypothetical protein MINTM005_12780 [Mycobacterium intracellulare]